MNKGNGVITVVHEVLIFLLCMLGFLIMLKLVLITNESEILKNVYGTFMFCFLFFYPIRIIMKFFHLKK